MRININYRVGPTLTRTKLNNQFVFEANKVILRIIDRFPVKYSTWWRGKRERVRESSLIDDFHRETFPAGFECLVSMEITKRERSINLIIFINYYCEPFWRRNAYEFPLWNVKKPLDELCSLSVHVGFFSIHNIVRLLVFCKCRMMSVFV